jgi:HlyD family secretion protein
MKRRIILLLVLLLVAGGGVVAYRAYTRPQPMIITGVVTTNEVVVSSQIQGQVQRLLVKEGDIVKAGQLLATIQPRELQADRAFYTHSEQSGAAQVSQAEAAVKYQEAQTRDQISQAEAALASAEAQVKEAEADLEQAELNYQRTEKLFHQTIDSQQQLDQARTTYDAQKAHLVSLQQQVDVQRAAVALAKSNEDQIQVRKSELAAMEHQLAAAGAQREKAIVRLDYTSIEAPISGVISLDAALQGEVVNIGQPIVTLINPDDLWIRADVEETYIDRIRLGDHFTVRLPDGREKEGTVFYRGVDADYATQRDVSRTKRDIKTFEVRLRMDNSDRRIWPGLTAYVILPPDVAR